jgi:crossover junction endodeoxyribonuclease RusA
MVRQDTLYPLEFFIEAVPLSLGSSSRSKDRWKAVVAETARQRQRETDELGFLDNRALAVTIYYFPSAPMEGDIDNIVKPILDALVSVAYLDDGVVERVVSQKFEPQVDWAFGAPSDQ